MLGVYHDLRTNVVHTFLVNWDVLPTFFFFESVPVLIVVPNLEIQIVLAILVYFFWK